MMIINAMIRISSSGTADGMTRTAMNLMDNTMINRVKTLIIRMISWKHMIVMGAVSQTREYHHDSPG